MRIQEIAAGRWAAETPLRFMGMDIGRRMTVLALDDDALMVHSPIEPIPEVRHQLDGIGRVKIVVAASTLHGRLSLREFQTAYPTAEVFAPPGLANKRSDVRFAGTLGDRPDARWATAVDQAIFRGPGVQEVVFLHRASRSLIVGDICFNIPPSASLRTRLWAFGPRLRPRIGPPPALRILAGRRTETQHSLDRILIWDFERIVVGHGDIVERDGPHALATGWGRPPPRGSSTAGAPS